jgi:hypothetical protein
VSGVWERGWCRVSFAHPYGVVGVGGRDQGCARGASRPLAIFTRPAGAKRSSKSAKQQISKAANDRTALYGWEACLAKLDTRRLQTAAPFGLDSSWRRCLARFQRAGSGLGFRGRRSQGLALPLGFRMSALRAEVQVQDRSGDVPAHFNFTAARPSRLMP